MTKSTEKAEYIFEIIEEIAGIAESDRQLEFLACLLRMAQAETVNIINAQSNKLFG
jgi:hypothetical protein